MKIFLTGANGLLGQKLVALISSDAQYQLLASGKGPNRNPAGRYTYYTANLLNQEVVMELLERLTPDVIIHAAAMTQVDACELNHEQCWEINVKATESLLSIARSIDSRFLYVSTDFVFDGQAGPYSETDEPNPINYYGQSKWRAEQLVRHSAVPWAIVRTVLVYGVANDPSRSNIVLWVKKSLEEGKNIQVVDDQIRTPTLAEDLAIGCVQLLRSEEKGIFHLSGSETVTPFDLAIKVAKFFRLDESLIHRASAQTFKEIGQRPPKTGFLIEKARKTLGFSPRTLEEGLRMMNEQLLPG